jgi:hypothetical protein
MASGQQLRLDDFDGTGDPFERFRSSSEVARDDGDRLGKGPWLERDVEREVFSWGERESLLGEREPGSDDLEQVAPRRNVRELVTALAIARPNDLARSPRLPAGWGKPETMLAPVESSTRPLTWVSRLFEAALGHRRQKPIESRDRREPLSEETRFRLHAASTRVYHNEFSFHYQGAFGQMRRQSAA